MHFANKHVISGLLGGIVLAVGGVAVYAHAGHGDGHGMHHSQRLSTTGSPAELAERARELGQHICENIKAATNCPVTPAADLAFNELGAMQDSYQHGQQRMHEMLTSASFDRNQFSQVQTEQAQAVQASTTRYLQFLADAAAALTPEQRQMFSHKEHAAQ